MCDDEGIGIIALHVCECMVDVSVMTLVCHLCENVIVRWIRECDVTCWHV